MDWRAVGIGVAGSALTVCGGIGLVIACRNPWFLLGFMFVSCAVGIAAVSWRR